MTFATVATTGDYEDLVNKPNLSNVAHLPTWIYDASSLMTEYGEDYVTSHGTKVNLETGETSGIGSTIDVVTSEHPGLMSKADKVKLDAYPAYSSITTALDGKVDTVSGKGLSTNDYTNDDKAKVDNLTVYYLPDASATLTNSSTSQQISDAIGGLAGIEEIITKIKDGVKIRLPKITSSASASTAGSAEFTYYWDVIPSIVSADEETTRGFSFSYSGYDHLENAFVWFFVIFLYFPDSDTFYFQKTSPVNLMSTQALLDTNNVINN